MTALGNYTSGPAVTSFDEQLKQIETELGITIPDPLSSPEEFDALFQRVSLELPEHLAVLQQYLDDRQGLSANLKEEFGRRVAMSKVAEKVGRVVENGLSVTDPKRGIKHFNARLVGLVILGLFALLGLGWVFAPEISKWFEPRAAKAGQAAAASTAPTGTVPLQGTGSEAPASASVESLATLTPNPASAGSAPTTQPAPLPTAQPSAPVAVAVAPAGSPSVPALPPLEPPQTLPNYPNETPAPSNAARSNNTSPSAQYRAAGGGQNGSVENLGATATPAPSSALPPLEEPSSNTSSNPAVNAAQAPGGSRIAVEPTTSQTTQPSRVLANSQPSEGQNPRTLLRSEPSPESSRVVVNAPAAQVEGSTVLERAQPAGEGSRVVSSATTGQTGSRVLVNSEAGQGSRILVGANRENNNSRVLVGRENPNSSRVLQRAEEPQQGERQGQGNPAVTQLPAAPVVAATPQATPASEATPSQPNPSAARPAVPNPASNPATAGSAAEGQPLVVNPFQPGIRVQGKVVAGVVFPEGTNQMPVMVEGADMVFFGIAVLEKNNRARIQIDRAFTRNTNYALNGMGVGEDGTMGLMTNSSEEAPNVWLNLGRGALQGIAAYVDFFAKSGSTTVMPNGAITTTNQAPSLGLSILSGAAKQFAAQPDQTSIMRVWRIAPNTPVTIIVVPDGYGR